MLCSLFSTCLHFVKLIVFLLRKYVCFIYNNKNYYYWLLNVVCLQLQVKWMMYWIVFALFTCTETFTDVFLSWFPFYYEVKIVLVLWLLSPATKGSSILYRKFVHPALCRREQVRRTLHLSIGNEDLQHVLDVVPVLLRDKDCAGNMVATLSKQGLFHAHRNQ